MKQQQQEKQAIEATTAVRTTFVRDDAQTRVGFTSHVEAEEWADAMGPRDSDSRRVRVRFRSRTGMWDVVVKSARQSKV
jgi:hypothetical protein